MMTLISLTTILSLKCRYTGADKEARTGCKMDRSIQMKQGKQLGLVIQAMTSHPSLCVLTFILHLQICYVFLICSMTVSLTACVRHCTFSFVLIKITFLVKMCTLLYICIYNNDNDNVNFCFSLSFTYECNNSRIKCTFLITKP